MSVFSSSYLLFFFFIFLFVYVRLSTCEINPIVSFDQNYHNTWGFQHFYPTNNGTEVQLFIDQYSGSGFMSNHAYGSGLFAMKIKIPKKDSLGIITALYLTSRKNNEPFGNHYEVDFEFLGGHGMPYTLQTNVFAKDSGGREERVNLWFDPTADFHTYQLLWNRHHIVFYVDKIPIGVFENNTRVVKTQITPKWCSLFYVDKIPIRVFENNTRIGVNYPSQAMSIVGSLWSDTTWASHGQPINWTEAPFVAYFQGFNINGCLENININTDHSECNSIKSTRYWWNGPRYMALDHTQTLIYENVRRKHLTYSYCDDRGYLHPECQMKKY